MESPEQGVGGIKGDAVFCFLQGFLFTKWIYLPLLHYIYSMQYFCLKQNQVKKSPVLHSLFMVTLPFVKTDFVAMFDLIFLKITMLRDIYLHDL